MRKYEFDDLLFIETRIKELRAKFTIEIVQNELNKQGVNVSYKRLRAFLRKRNISCEKKCEFCGTHVTRPNGKIRWCDECVPSKKAGGRASRYDISQIQFDDMLKKQNDACAICETSFLNKSCVNERAKSRIDHCHKTGKIRGILCQRCNQYMAALDEPGWLEKAVRYKNDTKNSTP